MQGQTRVPLWADANRHATEPRSFSINKPLFVSPEAAGRRITAGFSYLQRIGKSATTEVWFPDEFRQELDERLAAGLSLGPEQFPAEWAAVRQFELLQEAGNYKIYDLDVGNLSRTLVDLSRSMRAGGYRVTIATIGGYDTAEPQDDLHILDRRLQDRLSRLTHMLYLEETSADINAAIDRALVAEKWDYRHAIPHVGLTLGAKDLFQTKANALGETRHRLSRHFFDIVSLLPHKHIVHDTAVGLQLPESIAENEWIYLAESDQTLRAFNTALNDLFAPFNRVSSAGIDGHGYDNYEFKGSAQHMRGYGDRLTDEADKFHRDALRFTLQ